VKALSPISLKDHRPIFWAGTIFLLLIVTAAYLNLRSERATTDGELPNEELAKQLPSAQPPGLFPIDVDTLLAPYHPMEEMDNDPPMTMTQTAFASPMAATQDLPELMMLVSQGTRHVRASAFRSLCRINSAKARAMAMGTILSMYKEDAHSAMLKTFTNVDEPAVAELLVDLMIDSTDAGFKQWLQTLLTQMEGDSVTDALALVMIEHEDDPMQEVALATLARVQRPSALVALGDILASEMYPALTQAAARGVASIGNGDAVTMLRGHAAELTGASLDSVDALARVSSPYGQNALFQIVRDEPNPRIRAAAAEALGSYRGVETAARLRRQYAAETDLIVKASLAAAISTAEPAKKYSYPPDAEVSELTEMAWNE
jgi:hypothetical protein